MKIFVVDIRNPETLAMLQALYSRSHVSVEAYLKDLNGIQIEPSAEEKKLQEKMKTYYLGYGHESIADCGSATVFIENVSMIAAKAIQNNQLYNGQESSTRYIDFSHKDAELKNLLEKNYPEWYTSNKTLIDDIVNYSFTLYQNVYDNVYSEKKKQFFPDTEPSKSDDRAISAYAFDVARGFLPCGTTTQLSMHATLRTLRKHFIKLKHHCFAEVRNIAIEVLKQLYNKYPNSFKEKDFQLPNEEDVLTATSTYYISPGMAIDMLEISHLNKKYLEGLECTWNYEAHIHNLSSVDGFVTIRQYDPENGLDFGSWRDLQRHRNGICLPTIPIVLDGKYLGIGDWYYGHLDGFNFEEWNDIQNLLEKLSKKSKGSELIYLTSYLAPLGTPVATAVSYNMEEWDYIFNLRLRNTVHPTLTNFLSKVQGLLKKDIPSFSKYDDIVESLKNRDVSFQRGKHTITNSDGDSIG